MRKNIVYNVASAFDLETEECFKISDCDGYFYFTVDCLKHTTTAGTVEADDMLAKIVMGDVEVFKLPWKPYYRQKYWTFGLKDGIWVVVPREWEDYPAEYLLFKAGWIYRTEKEACAALPGVAKEMDVEFMVKEDSND